MTPYHSRQFDVSKRQSSPLPFIVFLLLIVSLIAYYGYYSHRSTSDALHDSTGVAKRFLDDLNAENYVAAEALLSDAAKLNSSPLALQHTMASYKDRYGNLLGASQTLFTTRNLGGLNTCKLEYKLRFERGSIPLQMILVRGYHNWAIDSLSFG